jgi:hypothetical protein
MTEYVTSKAQQAKNSRAHSKRSARLQKIIDRAQTLGPQVIRTLEVNKEPPATAASPTHPSLTTPTSIDIYNGMPLPKLQDPQTLRPVDHSPSHHCLCDIHIQSHSPYSNPVFTTAVPIDRSSTDISRPDGTGQPTTNANLLEQHPWHQTPLIQSLCLDSLQRNLPPWQKRRTSQEPRTLNGQLSYRINTQLSVPSLIGSTKTNMNPTATIAIPSPSWPAVDQWMTSFICANILGWMEQDKDSQTKGSHAPTFNGMGK